jgi:uncharacterized membrane protein YfcA
LIDLILIGILTGTISGFFGIGGGAVLVPMLMFAGLDIKEAIAISVVQMVFSSIYGSYLNYKAKTLDLKDGLYIGLGGSVGALFSGYVVANVSSFILKVMFLFFIGFAIYKFLTNSSSDEEKNTNTNKVLLFLIGMFIGAVAISIGVGGSTLLTPILVGYLAYKAKEATSMGLFFVIFSSIAGFVSMMYFGNLNISDGMIVGASSLIGVFLGIRTKNHMQSDSYKKYVIYLYVAIFVYTFYEVFRDF